MKKYKSRWFQKWANKNHLSDKALIDSIQDLKENKGTVKLGFNLFKVRVSSRNQGKRGAFRTIVVYVSDVRSIYVFGFSKNELDNISNKELEDFKELARTYTNMNEKEIKILLEQDSIFELEE
ncbi:MAG: type II toxin-antitoxin system RelE/ParE family toxin [Leptospiraceae bacterium]|nr:type II toxin-antitoxin system RelE/ParE family toxin [Leptospiraceae bacterium]MBK7058467.1 type II toxin-antitoxin system RelE/ParE family toxin [Leptospiraceae bacterium]MBK9503267.1 type II toxin-antitoxin system RelE/ParE family toxin [Leptospiraceae bacterium]MBL0262883.1 type II toxin-antitoxin system RelE/ParE family toxin [Leptospiraceae bacterium]MBP9163919.1 type II toxin-antitoxin system RelE/ParE family toxin [Leptospiraceae bacterium]